MFAIHPTVLDTSTGSKMDKNNLQEKYGRI